MKILYISPENTVGVLGAWKEIHNSMGNYARYITLYRGNNSYTEDICLDLPLVSTRSLYSNLREKFFRVYKKRRYDDEISGYPPTYISSGIVESFLYSIRDLVWQRRINKAIKAHNLFDFDIYHFEWGLDFFRDSRFAIELKNRGKKIVCHYHGQDMRTRGVIKEMDGISDLNITNEPDLLEKHPSINHIFLPFKLDMKTKKRKTRRLRVCHSPTNRTYKGTDEIIRIIERLKIEIEFDFILIEGLSHKKAMEMKAGCDIFIDQTTDLGGWGYGMSTIEAMSFGMCCICKMQPGVSESMNSPPIISADNDSLEHELRTLLNDRKKIAYYGEKAYDWCNANHGYEAVSNQLYEYYNSIL